MVILWLDHKNHNVTIKIQVFDYQGFESHFYGFYGFYGEKR